MKYISCFKYMGYIILIFTVIFLKGYIGNLFKIHYLQEHNLNININFYIVPACVGIFIGICIGVILGLEHLLREMNRSGSWKVNIPRLFFMGVPSLYISLTYLIFFSNIPFLQNIVGRPLLYLTRYGSDYHIFFQLILGYVIITSFYKRNDLHDEKSVTEDSKA